jgi:hypothetical protein
MLHPGERSLRMVRNLQHPQKPFPARLRFFWTETGRGGAQSRNSLGAYPSTRSTDGL